jgi:hypothetical protein
MPGPLETATTTTNTVTWTQKRRKGEGKWDGSERVEEGTKG